MGVAPGYHKRVFGFLLLTMFFFKILAPIIESLGKKIIGNLVFAVDPV